MRFFKKKNYKLKLRNLLEALEYNNIDELLEKEPEFFSKLGNVARTRTLKLINKNQ